MSYSVTQDEIQSYMQQINAYPLLTQEEEQDIILRAYGDPKDKDAVEKLFLHSLRLVVWYAHKYSGYPVDLSDLIQEGNLGLLKSIENYDISHGAKFGVYAGYWIKSYMNLYVMNNFSIVKIAQTKPNRKLFFKLRSYPKKSYWLSESEIEQIAIEFGVKTSDVRTMEMRLRNYDVSQSVSLSEDGDVDIVDLNSYNDVITDIVSMPDELHENRIYEEFLSYINNMNPRTKHIIEQRWLTSDSKTFGELSKELGVSEQRIHQIEKAELTKMKTHFESYREAC